MCRRECVFPRIPVLNWAFQLFKNESGSLYTSSLCLFIVSIQFTRRQCLRRASVIGAADCRPVLSRLVTCAVRAFQCIALVSVLRPGFHLGDCTDCGLSGIVTSAFTQVALRMFQPVRWSRVAHAHCMAPPARHTVTCAAAKSISLDSLATHTQMPSLPPCNQAGRSNPRRELQRDPDIDPALLSTKTLPKRMSVLIRPCSTSDGPNLPRRPASRNGRPWLRPPCCTSRWRGCSTQEAPGARRVSTQGCDAMYRDEMG